jgi:histidine ammonia-lyase
VLAIEMICALQAVELRGIEKMAPVTKRLYENARTITPSITQDRVFAKDIENIKNWMVKGWTHFLVDNNHINPVVKFAI